MNRVRNLRLELTNLASLGVGGEQVNDLDTGDEDLLLHAHLAELGRLSVNSLVYSKVKVKKTNIDQFRGSGKLFLQNCL